MTRSIDMSDFIWVPLTNNTQFGQLLLANDWVDLDTMSVPSDLSVDHLDARSSLRDLHNVRVSIWGTPDSDAVNSAEKMMRDIGAELPRYSNAYFLATLTYYIGVSVQFLMTVQMNPVHIVDDALRVGKVEKQARILMTLLDACAVRYAEIYPKWAESSSLMRYAKHMRDPLERMATSDIFNPMNKECIPLERLRSLAGGRVSVHGMEKGWIVRGPKGTKLGQNVDGGVAIMDAISKMQFEVKE